jgi:hypothetical protein
VTGGGGQVEANPPRFEGPGGSAPASSAGQRQGADTATGITPASPANATGQRPATQSGSTPTNSTGPSSNVSSKPTPTPRLIDRALQAAKKRATEQHHQARDRVAGIDTELVKTEQAIERYLLAFESGTLPEAACGQRIQALADKAATLRDHRAVLSDELDNAQERPTSEDLEIFRRQVADAITRGDIHAQKHLLQVLIQEIRAAARNDIQPIFKIPTTPGGVNPKVRKQKGSVGAPGRTRTCDARFRK